MAEPEDQAAAAPFQFKWRIHPQDKPEETAAELVFSHEAGQETGTLEITAENPAMKSLVTYFLLDPMDHRPLFFRDTGTLHGPHWYTFGQIDRSLLDFNREFPGFRAVRASEFPILAPPDAG